MAQLEWCKIGIIIVSYLGIFALSKLFHARFPDKVELSRKISHFCGGILSLFLPFLFTSHRSVLLLSVLFIGYLLLMKKLHRMNAVYSVKRKSYGVLLFPVSVYLLFYLSSDRPAYYIIPLLTLTVADTAAALIGVRYGTLRFDIDGNRKSVEGTIAFFFVTFLCVHIPLLLMTDVGRLQSLIVAFIIAAAVTGFELISLVGTDNLFIPVGTYYIINRILKYPFAVTMNTLLQLLISVVGTVILFVPVKAVRLSWMITMMLFNFACLTLCGYPPWLVPLVLFEVCLVIVLVLFSKQDTNNKYRYDIIAALYMVVLPVIFLFVSVFMDEYTRLQPYFIIVLCANIVFILGDYLEVSGKAEGGGAHVIMAVFSAGIAALFYFSSAAVAGSVIGPLTFMKYAVSIILSSLVYRISSVTTLPGFSLQNNVVNRVKLISSVAGILLFSIISTAGY